MHAALLLVALIAADELSPDVLDMFAEVLGRGHYGLREEEAAAFIIRKENGDARCMLWPPTAEYHKARFKWPPPSGVVAIVHTHPIDLPCLSTADKASAIRLGIPVYAITPSTIYKADAFGITTAVTRDRRWFRDHNSGRKLCSLDQNDQ
jgi:proteasome lid subunit RPN8/RPN11